MLASIVGVCTLLRISGTYNPFEKTLKKGKREFYTLCALFFSKEFTMTLRTFVFLCYSVIANGDSHEHKDLYPKKGILQRHIYCNLTLQGGRNSLTLENSRTFFCFATLWKKLHRFSKVIAHNDKTFCLQCTSFLIALQRFRRQSRYGLLEALSVSPAFASYRP